MWVPPCSASSAISSSGAVPCVHASVPHYVSIFSGQGIPAMGSTTFVSFTFSLGKEIHVRADQWLFEVAHCCTCWINIQLEGAHAYKLYCLPISVGSSFRKNGLVHTIVSFRLAIEP